jgi:hypothetical protein
MTRFQKGKASNMESCATNLQCFEAAAADMLSRLYRSFPEPLDFDYTDEFAAAKGSKKMPDHCASYYATGDTLYGATLRFLEREGAVYIDEDKSRSARGVTLTSKGFLILNRPLDLMAEGNSPTLGRRLAEAVGKNAVSSAVGALIGVLAKNLQS